MLTGPYRAALQQACLERNTAPQLSDGERHELAAHYLSPLTWQQACHVTEIDFALLESTTADLPADAQ